MLSYENKILQQSQYCFLFLVMSLSLGSEKQEEIGKEEWMNRLSETQVTRADMNKLIMNYLVTGKQCIKDSQTPVWDVLRDYQSACNKENSEKIWKVSVESRFLFCN